eukprot:TRINITY_DN17328_c0_g1_i1.p1 TRINITY_DN17328_c0_g1~~TRINITY_DN17328_c0_g1_i1.p1  ORF type:complete len:562 (+),score=10.77 TRINITY_DN17328_c0_g1_i1:35-1720(+)
MGWSSPRTALGLAAAFAFIPSVQSVNVFVFGDYVQNEPAGCLILTVIVIVLTILLEMLFHVIDHKIKNQYVRKIVLHIFEELKMLGIISLLLTLLVSFLPPDGHLYTLGFYLFEWAHMLLFFFAMIFCLIVGIFFISIRLTWRRWLYYEDKMRKAGETAGGIEAAMTNNTMRRFAKVFRLFSIQITEIHPHYKDISFCRYLKKNQRRNLVFVIAMNWKSWAALGVISLLNSIRGWALRSKVAAHWNKMSLPSLGPDDWDVDCLCSLCPATTGCTHESFPLNLVLFVSIVGFGPLVVALVQFLHLYKGYLHFLSHEADAVKFETLPESAEQSNGHTGDPNLSRPLLETDEGHIPLYDHKNYFWFRKPDLELQLLQIILIYEVYYLTVLLLSMIAEVLHHMGAGAIHPSDGAVGVVLIIVGFVPPLCFVLMTPAAVQILTILSSTGNLLDRQTLQDIYNKDEKQRQSLIQQVKDTEEQLEEPDPEDDTPKAMSRQPTAKHMTLNFDDKKPIPRASEEPSSFSALIMARAQQRQSENESALKEQTKPVIESDVNDPANEGAETL